jgi:serine/threonine protein kinase
MPKRPGPDDPGAPATADSGSSGGPKLTSDDIFGEILEEVGGERLGAAGAAQGAAQRSGPIKVQVEDPMAGGRPLPRPSAPPSRPGGHAPRELRPEDVDVLLDAFSGPMDLPVPEPVFEHPDPVPVPDPDPVADPDPAPEVLFEEVPEPEFADLPEPSFADAPEAEAVPVPEPREPSPLVLELDGEAPPPWMSQGSEGPDFEEALPPPPPAPRAASADGTQEGLRDLMNLMRVNKGRAHRMDSGHNKFTAASPASSATLPDLDLGAVAEQALDEAYQPAPAMARAYVPAPGPTVDIHYGPYRLLQRIAVGGMAEVFRAKRTGVEGFEKVVAVKRILPHLSDNKEFVDMFIDEAKMVAGLTHPNIVQIFDLGKIDRTYFIAMDYVHGRDLRTIMRRGREKGLRIPLDLSLLVVSRVCSALEFAHRKKDERGVPMKIVHRDVSPQNILISFEGEVKLTDFGIAKAATKATITDSGALRGKLLYMSPEQAWGKPMDRRSDVFSLGIVFYEMVTDQKPFLATSEMSILETVRECRVVPPSQVNPRVPEKLERVLLKALARDVDERYQDAAEMYRDLERVLHERQPPTSAELTRFMELLFDEAERGEVSADAHEPPAPAMKEAPVEVAADPPAADAAGEHEELAGAPPPPEPEAEEVKEAEPEPKPATRDPMSIQKLLKRFGIK